METRRAPLAAAAAAVVLVVAVPFGWQAVTGRSAPPPADDPVFPTPTAPTLATAPPEVSHASSKTPARVADLPTGPPPVIPYALDRPEWENDELHVDGDTFRIPREVERFDWAGSTVLMAARDATPADLEGWPATQVPTTTWVVGDDGRQVLDEGQAVEAPVLSADGTRAAITRLSEKATYGWRVEVYDVADGEVVDTFETGRLPAGIDGAGRIVLDDEHGFDRDGKELRTVDGSTLPLDVPDGEIVAVTGAGLVLDTGAKYAYGRVDETGTFHRTGVLDLDDRRPHPPMLAHHGSLIASSQHADAPARTRPPVVVDVGTGEETRLRIPEDALWSGVHAFEGSQNVIAGATTSPDPSVQQTYLRCSVTSGACDRIAGWPPEGTVGFGHVDRDW